MNRKIIISFLVIVGAVLILFSLVYCGVITFPTMESLIKNGKPVTTVMSINDLKDNCFYVWHDSGTNEITDDLEGTTEAAAFQICPTGTINWKENTNIKHTVWFTSSNDKDIPTIYPGDKLLYISATKVPHEGIQWERFADYGYTIGVANMTGDNSGHYYIVLDAEDGYEGYINPESDAYVLEQYDYVPELFLDKLGSVRVRNEHISDGGTVYGLEKNTKYLCEWYSGTYYQDFEMIANNHTFCSLESFTTYEYEFLHSRCISITIPDWLKSGYYYVNGIGMFRYVLDKDQDSYNGEAYDESINWNDPIILYDERGSVVYDPSSNINENISDKPVSNDSIVNFPGNGNMDDSFTQEMINESDSGVSADEVQDEEIVE